MSAPAVVVPKEQALSEARRALDAARARRDADYLAGRLTGRRLEVFERLLAERDAEQAAQRAAV